MSIERSEAIRFHEKGTLNAVTRWIAAHHEGIAEWFKNVRRQYQVDRADVADESRAVIQPKILFDFLLPPPPSTTTSIGPIIANLNI